MREVVETPEFAKEADKIWSEDERLDFVSWIAFNPTVGDVIPNADGARKVRWAAKGRGKRGGAWIIYFNQDELGKVYLIAIYAKSEKENIDSNDIKKLSE